MLAAVALSVVIGGKPALSRLGRRCLIGRSWLLIAILIPSALFFFSTAIVSVLYEETIAWANLGRGSEFLELPMPIS